MTCVLVVVCPQESRPFSRITVMRAPWLSCRLSTPWGLRGPESPAGPGEPFPTVWVWVQRWS